MITGLSPRGKSLLATIVLAALAISYLLFVFKPKHQAIGELRAELRDKQEYLQTTSHIVAAVNQTEADLRDVEQFVEQWKEKAPLETKLASLFAEIAQQGKSAGVTVARFDPRPIDRLNSLWRVPVDISAEGGYPQIFDFIHRLEGLGVSARLDEFHLEAADSTISESETNAVGGGGVGAMLRCELTWVVFADRRDFSD